MSASAAACARSGAMSPPSAAAPVRQGRQCKLSCARGQAAQFIDRVQTVALIAAVEGPDRTGVAAVQGITHDRLSALILIYYNEL